MAKAAKRGRPPGERPAISVRVSQELFDRIQAEAKKTGQSMAGTVAALWQRVFAYERALGDFQEAQHKLASISASNLKAEMGRKGWRLGPDGTWVDPDSDYGKALPKNGFLSEEEAASFHAPEQPAVLSDKAKEALGEVVAPQLTAIEERLARIEAAIARPRPVVIVEGDAGERKRA